MNREYKLYGVRALYPRLNGPYHFDAIANKSMPCSYDAPDAKYECNFIITPDQAWDVIKQSLEAFKMAAKPNWQPWAPKHVEEMFGADLESDNFILKSVKKTYGENGNAPKQFLTDGSIAPEGFMLTSGSLCHVVLTLAPWNYAGRSGVTFRLKALKVVQLADAPVATDPFASDDLANANTKAVLAQAASNVDEFGLPNDEIPFGI